MNLSNELALPALLALVLVPRVRERRSAQTTAATRAEWASVDLLPRG